LTKHRRGVFTPLTPSPFSGYPDPSPPPKASACFFVHPNPLTKRRLGRFIIFCTVHIESNKQRHTEQGCSGAGTRPPLPPLFGLKFVQKLVHYCNWLLTETQCRIILVQHVCRPKLFKNICLSLVSGVPHFFFRTMPLTRYDTRCYFNVRSKADISQLNLPRVRSNRSVFVGCF